MGMSSQGGRRKKKERKKERKERRNKERKEERRRRHEAFTANKCKKKNSWVISRVKFELRTSVLETHSVSMIGINMGNEMMHISQSI
jgi:hypothetical protein